MQVEDFKTDSKETYLCMAFGIVSLKGKDGDYWKGATAKIGTLSTEQANQKRMGVLNE